MCGICGFINNYKISNESDILEKMLATLKHRGPDDSGFYIDETIPSLGLAQSRLSIIDTSSNGHQPMHFEKLSIVFNGEIYNYKELKIDLITLGHEFKTESDTEVVLHAHTQWGELAVNKFIGMFSYVLYDKKSNKLFCYRDRAGVKPFYYYLHEGIFLFSSEVKAFHQHPKFIKQINNDAVYSFFRLGYIPAPDSIFQNTYKLEAGHYLTFDLKTFSFKISRYWDINHYYEKPSFKIDYQDAKEELEKLLISSCQYRMIADVPVGVFLSGGYDSTLITSILQQNQNERIKTFTIGFEDGTNEAPFAKKISNYIGTEHTEMYCTGKDAKEILLELPFYFDEPFADNSAIPTIMVSKLAKRNVTVALSADGGDELFGGYEHYKIINNNLSSLNKIPNLYRNRVKQFSTFLNNNIIPNYYVSLKHKLNGLSEVINLPLNNKTTKLYEQMSYLPTFYLDNLLIYSKKTPEKIFLNNYLNFNSHYSIPLAIDFKNFLQNDILVKVDRASMSQGLEAREPLLDHRLIEYVSQLPYSFKNDNSISKKILKEITYNYVPKELLNRPKIGFNPPINNWLRSDFRDIVNCFINEEKLNKTGYINSSFALKLKKEFDDGKLYYKQIIWRILQFQMWYEKWMN